MPRSFFLAAALAAAALPIRAQTTMADAFARLQDFASSPPSLDSYLVHLLGYIEPNQSIEHLTGPPFPSPGPWFLPPGLWSYSGECKSGSAQTSTNPLCVTRWKECFITLVFTDGSRYSFEDIEESTVCSDGSSASFRKRTQVSELGSPGQRDALVRVQSWAQDALETRRHQLRARPGAVAAFQNLAGTRIVDGGTCELEFAPGAVLDLRGNAPAAGPLFVTDAPMLLRCDTILLDPGVSLPTIFSLPPMVLPGALVAEVSLPARTPVQAAAPASIALRVANLGNCDVMVTVAWSGAFTTAGQTTLPLAMAARQPVTIPVQLPPGTVNGGLGAFVVQATPAGAPAGASNAAVHVVVQHPGVFRFGAGTPGCLGAHATAITGPLAAGGPAVTLTADGNNPSGIGLWLFGETVGGNYGTLAPPGIAALLVDPFGPWFVTQLFVADGSGIAIFPLQVAADPALRGFVLHSQPVGLWLGPCSPGTLTFSSGPALGIEVQ